MLRGELAIAAIVILGIIALIDAFTGNGESLGVFFGILVVSALFTVVASIFKRT